MTKKIKQKATDSSGLSLGPGDAVELLPIGGYGSVSTEEVDSEGYISVYTKYDSLGGIGKPELFKPYELKKLV